jgi:hypothetical protein
MLIPAAGAQLLSIVEACAIAIKPSFTEPWSITPYPMAPSGHLKKMRKIITPVSPALKLTPVRKPSSTMLGKNTPMHLVSPPSFVLDTAIAKLFGSSQASFPSSSASSSTPGGVDF